MLPDRVSNPGPLTYESGALPIALRGPSFPVPNGHSEQFSLKSIKGIYIPAKIIIPCQFITDPLKSLLIIK